jgi:hypothetical protein
MSKRVALVLVLATSACHSDKHELDGGVNDASAAFDASVDGATPFDDAGELDGTAPPGSMFAMTVLTEGTAHFPTEPFVGLRLWDTNAVWPNLNTAAGTYDFSALDGWLAEAQTEGVDVMFTFGRTPTWASSNETQACGYDPGCAAPPTDLASGDTILKSFVTALVQHSLASPTAHIKYYEIWNEPDLQNTWSGTPAQLVTMGKDIYETVHALDPKALVIGPSPSTGNQFGIHFLPDYYAAGGAPYEDIVGLHAYLYTGSAFSTVPEGIIDTITQLKILMSANHVGSLPIFFTEGSWGGAPANASMTSDQKVAYLGREYVLMWDASIARYYWYAWDNASWGTMLSGTTVQPDGVAYGLVRKWLDGAAHTPNSCAKAADSTYTCPLTYEGQPARILWNPTSTPSEIVPAAFGHYLTLDDATVEAIATGHITVGAKPVMLVP